MTLEARIKALEKALQLEDCSHTVIVVGDKEAPPCLRCGSTDTNVIRVLHPFAEAFHE